MKPWDRRENESSQAFAAFQSYLTLGDKRSTDKVSKECGKSWSIIQRWCSRHDWVDRVRVWESMNAEEERREFAKERFAMVRRHAATAVQLQRAGLQKLQDLQAVDAQKIDLRDVPRFIEVGVKVERISRGMSTDNVQVESLTKADVDGFLDALVEMVRYLAYMVPEERRNEYQDALDEGIARIFGGADQS